MMVGRRFLPQSGLGNWRQSLVKCFQGLGGKGVLAGDGRLGALGLEAGVLRPEPDDLLPRSSPFSVWFQLLPGNVKGTEDSLPPQGGTERVRRCTDAHTHY